MFLALLLRVLVLLPVCENEKMEKKSYNLESMIPKSAVCIVSI